MDIVRHNNVSSAQTMAEGSKTTQFLEGIEKAAVDFVCFSTAKLRFFI